MKSLMSYVLTKKEKAAIVVLLLLILLTGWYVGIYSPIQERIEAADTTDLEDAIAMEQVKSARIKSMQAEIQENKDADAPIFEIADIGIVGRCEKILPLMIEAIRSKNA